MQHDPKVGDSRSPWVERFSVSKISTTSQEHPFMSRQWMLLPAYSWHIRCYLYNEKYLFCHLQEEHTYISHTGTTHTQHTHNTHTYRDNPLICKMLIPHHMNITLKKNGFKMCNFSHTFITSVFWQFWHHKYSTYKGYPTKRALSAMHKHGHGG